MGWANLESYVIPYMQLLLFLIDAQQAGYLRRWRFEVLCRNGRDVDVGDFLRQELLKAVSAYIEVLYLSCLSLSNNINNINHTSKLVVGKNAS